MKKILLSLAAVAMLAACSKEDTLVQQAPEAIGFDNAFVENSTRSVNDPSWSNGNLFSNFGVYGFVENAPLFDNVEVKVLDTLLVDFCRREGARVVLRGVRVYSDFEYEFQMALINRRMAPEIETLFMMPSENLAYVTASTVREIASYGGDTAPFVTDVVQNNLEKRKA